MKAFIFLIALSLGVSSMAADGEYTINHACNSDELAGVVNIEAQVGGNFAVKATCLPAICSFRVNDVRWSVNRPKNYQVFRVPEISFMDGAKNKIKFVKLELIHEFVAYNKEEARTETEKLVSRGLCKSAKYDLNLPEL